MANIEKSISNLRMLPNGVTSGMRSGPASAVFAAAVVPRDLNYDSAEFKGMKAYFLSSVKLEFGRLDGNPRLLIHSNSPEASHIEISLGATKNEHRNEQSRAYLESTMGRILELLNSGAWQAPKGALRK